MKLVDANPTPKIEGLDELPGKSNYFIGNDPANWRANVPTFARVKYRSVYPGIDLVYYGSQRQLEYDFVVRPGGDPGRIALNFEGADKLEIDAKGDLVLEVAGGQVKQHRPIVYQDVNGLRRQIAASSVLLNRHEVGFRVSSYDRSQPLVIDPSLVYSTYLGGRGLDYGFGIAIDTSGNAYVTGYTTSSNFPTGNPFQTNYGGDYDAFVTKLNRSGSALVYSTYLGGNSFDYGSGIAVDSSGNVYVTGYTTSTNFPTANPYQAKSGGIYDAFVAKLSSSGSALVYSTYLGGNSFDYGSGIAIDSSGNAYVAGTTQSTNFPTVNPFQANHGDVGLVDTFVTKLNSSGSALLYSTYLGGNSFDYGSGIAIDSSGNAYVTGTTQSTNFPIVNAFQVNKGDGYDVFVTKLNPSGSALVYSTYLGGNDGDGGFGIAVDSSGNAYVTGRTTSTDFPTANPFQAKNGGGGNYDAVVTKLNASGSALVYSTYLGGNSEEVGSGIAVDSSGNAYVTGHTSSGDFPTANPFQANRGGDWDVFVTKLNPSGSTLVYSTYHGGNENDYGWGLAIDSSGNAYVTGETRSSNFPTANPLQASSGGGMSDAFLVKIDNCDYVISPLSRQHGSGTEAGTVAVTADATCNWTAASNSTFITITSAATGRGNGTVAYSVSANTGTTERTGTLTVAGKTFTVTQTVACPYTISPTSSLFPSGGGTGVVTVSVSPGCSWTATSNASFITIFSGSTGTGNGTVGYSVSANTSTSQRTGTMTIAGRTFTVTQDGITCAYTISPTSNTFSSSGGTGSVSVAAQSVCTWTATSNASFITITSGSSGSGNGTVSYSVSENSSTSLRTGTMTIAGRTFTVTQDGLTCTYSISPSSNTFGSNGGTGNVSVTTSPACAWTATSNASFITITSGTSGSGNGTLGYSVAANTATSQRTGTLSIAGQTFTVIQDGIACTYAISPSSNTFTSIGGTGNVSVTTSTGCSWTATSNASFITITSGSSGNGNGTVNYSVAANTGISQRTGTLTIAGLTFTATQEGISCAYTISPTSNTFTSIGGSGTISVTTDSVCSWTATSNASFIAITFGSTGVGNGTVAYSISANTGILQRTGTITAAGKTFTIQQDGISCTYAINPGTASFAASGGQGTVTVRTTTGCPWTAVTNVSFINITSGTSGIGNGSVNYDVAQNSRSEQRIGAMTIAGQTFTVSQAGASNPPPTLDITMSQSSYTTGDTVTVTEFRVRNPRSTITAVNLRVWFDVPTVGEVALIDIGGDGTFSLPASVDANLAPLSLFTITAEFPPRGNWGLNSRFTDPTTGAVLSEDLNPFVIK